MLITLSGIVTLVILSQALNVSSQIAVTFSGTVYSVIPAGAIACNELSTTRLLPSEVANLPLNSARFAQPINGLRSIAVTLSGRVIVVRAVLQWKEYRPIDVTLCGITMLASVLHSQNAI